MRKVMLIALAALLALAVVGVPLASAAPQGPAAPVLLYRAAEITDPAELLSRAARGVSEDPATHPVLRCLARCAQTGDSLELPMWATVQKLEEWLNPDGSRKASYALTAFTLVRFDHRGMVEPLWTNYIRKSEVDSSISARHTLTQYYSKTTSQGMDYVKVDYYTGKWERLDPQCQIKNATMLAGANGPRLEGGWTYGTKDRSIGYPTLGIDYYLYTPGDWGYVCIGDLGLYQAGRMDCTLRRVPTGYEWDFGTLIVQGSLDFPWP